MQEADGVPLNFRYHVKQKTKVSIFEAKDAPANSEPMSMRATLMGSMLKGHFTKLPKSAISATVWEVSRMLTLNIGMSQVRLEAGVPTKVVCLKPKYWLTSKIVVDRKTAVRLG